MPSVSIQVSRVNLQARIDRELQADGVTTVFGEQQIDGPVYIRYPGRVVFENAVLRPTLIWDPVDAVLVVKGSDVVLEGTLEIDERGSRRVGSNSVGQTVLFTNLDGFDASRLHLKCSNTGIATSIDTLENDRAILESVYEDTLESLFDADALPSGPDVLFVGLDALGDYYDEGTYLGEVGPCRNGRVGLIECVRGTDTKRAFAVRLATNFLANRAYDDFTNPCENITIDRAIVTGVYDWNAIEMLGTGTRAIRFGHVIVTGKTGCALDFDKGCSRCSAGRVEVFDSGKSATYVGDSSIRFAAVNIHGSSSSQTTDDCSVDEIIVRDATSASTDVYESAFSCQYASNVRVGVVDVDGLNGGNYGAGVLVDTGVDQLHVGALRTRNVRNGIVSNANSPIGDLTIDALDIESEGTAIAIAVAGASGRVQLGSGRVRCVGTLGGGVPQVSFDAELTRADVGAVDVSGGGSSGIGFFTACRTSIVGASIRGQNYGIQAIGAAATVRCIGVDAATSIAGQTSTGSGGSIVGAGNSWED